jgi:hypothetical protein
MRAVTQLLNSILRTGHLPGLWKVSQIIPILKPGKLPEEAQSYRPVSLLPVLSKVFEKLLITGILPTLQEKQVVPDHQFGFRKKNTPPLNKFTAYLTSFTTHRKATNTVRLPF